MSHRPFPVTDPLPAELAEILDEVAPPGGCGFRHRQHIHLAFIAVRRHGTARATEKISTWIRHLTAHAPQKYHATVTRAWTEIVGHHVAADPSVADFEVFAEQNRALLDKRLLTRHYTAATLASPQARTGWVEPDIAPFPWSSGRGTARRD
jgi:hypothetical protein